MSASTVDLEKFKPLIDTITNRPPYCSGIMSVRPGDVTVFYGKEKDARRINFSNCTNEELEQLFQACDPATFGLNEEDVYDETYRKAGKMDKENFSLTLDLESTGLKDAIRERLLGGTLAKRPIRAELYKLNEWAIDSANTTSSQDGPRVGYVALYSDVEHEVNMVTSGHRVTVTYNLYFDEPTVNPAANPISHGNTLDVTKLRSKLEKLLIDPEFLKEGANIGFGLNFQYPIESSPQKCTNLQDLENCLKGVDGEIMQVLKDLSLKPKLWLIVKVGADIVVLREKYGAKIIDSDSCSIRHGFVQLDFKVQWITKPEREFADKKFFMAFGNEAQLVHVYRDLAIIVPIGKPGARSCEIIQLEPPPQVIETEEYSAESELDWDY
ncbi:hypothetical protein AMATHDRAFT_5416 [Amanita thiersii Skay4041]|uniref:Uncharacterized protein n=1 Tax=Amanita thiersii Skay4041 TaxID=703135 RepID=A0A2A9NKJ2_9AGAR|nr:hypothetical protein AMATHDRAFT_5416 [Amanita thiersii Skay4041]